MQFAIAGHLDGPPSRRSCLPLRRRTEKTSIKLPSEIHGRITLPLADSLNDMDIRLSLA
jgi:hypothetical protein